MFSICITGKLVISRGGRTSPRRGPRKGGEKITLGISTMREVEKHKHKKKAYAFADVVAVLTSVSASYVMIMLKLASQMRTGLYNPCLGEVLTWCCSLPSFSFTIPL